MGCQTIVTVNVPEIIAISSFDSSAARLKQALVLLPNYLNGHNRLRGKPLIDSRATVSRAIIDDDDLVVGIVLARNTVQTFSEVCFDVVYRNDY